MIKKIMAMFSAFALLLTPIALADSVSVSTDVDKFITATFQYSAVAYGSQSAGASDVGAPNQANGVYNVTVDTNFEYKVSASGSNFSDGGTESFAISNLKMDTNSTAGNLAVGDSIALSTGAQDIDTQRPTTETVSYHGYWLSIPSDQYATSYSTTLTVTVANEA